MTYWLEFSRCPECGKKGVHKKLASDGDGMECRYCKFWFYTGSPRDPIDVQNEQRWQEANIPSEEEVRSKRPTYTGPPPIRDEAQLADIWSKVDKSNPSGCWVWRGVINERWGYGYYCFSHAQKNWRAHRLIWTLTNGDIPPGKVLDHLCHDPEVCEPGPQCPHRRCVNPAHMKITTRGENAKRTRPPRQTLTEDDVREIRRIRAEEGTVYWRLAWKFNTTTENIQAIIKRRSWKHVA